jgi:hypothetical protein
MRPRETLSLIGTLPKEYMIVKARRKQGLHVQAIEVVDHGKDVIVGNDLRIE